MHTDKFLTGTLSLTDINSKTPKRLKFEFYLDYETAVHIVLPDAACG